MKNKGTKMNALTNVGTTEALATDNLRTPKKGRKVAVPAGERRGSGAREGEASANQAARSKEPRTPGREGVAPQTAISAASTMGDGVGEEAARRLGPTIWVNVTSFVFANVFFRLEGDSRRESISFVAARA